MSPEPPAGARRPVEEERLFAEVRALIARGDPVPPAVEAAAHATLAWRAIDAQLASLTYDSAADPRLNRVELLAVRGDVASRMLVFDGPDLSVDLQVLLEGSRRIVLGQLVPVQAAQVILRASGGERHAHADARGRFRFDDLPSGSATLRCVLPNGATLQTERFTL